MDNAVVQYGKRVRSTHHPGVFVGKRPLPHERSWGSGRFPTNTPGWWVERTRLPYWTTALSITVRSAPTGLTVAIWRCSATGAPYARTPRSVSYTHLTLPTILRV